MWNCCCCFTMNFNKIYQLKDVWHWMHKCPNIQVLWHCRPIAFPFLFFFTNNAKLWLQPEEFKYTDKHYKQLSYFFGNKSVAQVINLARPKCISMHSSVWVLNISRYESAGVIYRSHWSGNPYLCVYWPGGEENLVWRAGSLHQAHDDSNSQGSCRR